MEQSQTQCGGSVLNPLERLFHMLLFHKELPPLYSHKIGL
jgi:hypothetical protein